MYVYTTANIWLLFVCMCSRINEACMYGIVVVPRARPGQGVLVLSNYPPRGSGGGRGLNSSIWMVECIQKRISVIDSQCISINICMYVCMLALLAFAETNALKRYVKQKTFSYISTYSHTSALTYIHNDMSFSASLSNEVFPSDFPFPACMFSFILYHL